MIDSWIDLKVAANYMKHINISNISKYSKYGKADDKWNTYIHETNEAGIKEVV